jgi:WS/DGAT/MGAT family acyltransferase
LEGPTTPTHVVGLVILDPSTAPKKFTYRRFRSHFISRLGQMSPMLTRIVEVPFAVDHPLSLIDPDFDVDQHLQRVKLKTGTRAEFEALAGRFATEPLRRDRPLWDLLYVDGIEDGRVAFMLKAHHAVMDGGTGLEVMTALMDLEAAPAVSPPVVPHPIAANATPGSWDMLTGAVRNRLTDPLRPIRAGISAGASIARVAGTMFSRRMGGATSAARPLSAPRVGFNGALTAERAIAFGTVDMSLLKDTKNRAGVTVNDVVLAACTLGLREHLLRHDTVPEKPLVASVPVSTHAAKNGDGGTATNSVSNVFVSLPTYLVDPIEVLEFVHASATAAKEVGERAGTDILADTVELIPGLAFSIGATWFSRIGLANHLPPAHNLIVSNVAGAPFPVYFAGARAVEMYPFGPLVEGSGLNITVLSSGGLLNLGVLACPDLVPEHGWLCEDILEGFRRLATAVGVG